jgi:hypothetical protein
VLPGDLQGVWRTSHDKYADIHFELQPQAVVLHAGEGEYQSHPITGVKAEAQADASILYRVMYRHTLEDSDMTFAFFYSSRQGGVIRFKNQQDIEWRKEAPKP